MTGDRKYGLAVYLGEWFERNRDAVPRYIERYFYGVGTTPKPFDGRNFETFAEMADPSRFAPTDILAAQALSVTIPSGSILRLLRDDAEKFNKALANMPHGEFWSADRAVFESNGPAMKLFRLLDAPGVGTTKATKLMAANRPHLVPVQDAFIEEELIEPDGKFWLLMYDQLSDAALRKMISDLTAAAPAGVSLLRKIDVSVWMHVNDRKRAARKKERG